MPKPFERDIPYFPGEDRSSLPTQESSVFNTPGVVESLELIQSYTSPLSNSRKRREILQQVKAVCFDDGYFDVFQRILHEGIENTQDNDTLSKQNHHRILNEMYDQVDNLYLHSGYTGTRDVRPDIPEEVLEGRQNLDTRIKLVNTVLQRTFPSLYGVVIPEIENSDVRVIPDRDLLRFQLDDGRYENHPFMRDSFNEYSRRIGSDLRFSYSDKESSVMVQVVSLADGMPILFPQSELEISHPELSPTEKEILSDFVIGSALLHENFHRSTTPLWVGSIGREDPLFSLAFGPEDKAAQEMIEDNRPHALHYKEYVEGLKTYALENEPVLRIDGTRVQIWCNDEKGIRRMITDSGHDLNESVVEALTYHSLNQLFSQLYEQYGKNPAIQKLINLKNEMAKSDGTYRHANLLGFVVPYLKRLGLENPEETLKAYSQGKIPQLHTEKLPEEKYMF